MEMRSIGENTLTCSLEPKPVKAGTNGSKLVSETADVIRVLCIVCVLEETVSAC